MNRGSGDRGRLGPATKPTPGTSPMPSSSLPSLRHGAESGSRRRVGRCSRGWEVGATGVGGNAMYTVPTENGHAAEHALRSARPRRDVSKISPHRRFRSRSLEMGAAIFDTPDGRPIRVAACRGAALPGVGAKCDARNDDSRTPLDVAIQREGEAVIAALRAVGAEDRGQGVTRRWEVTSLARAIPWSRRCMQNSGNATNPFEEESS